MASAQRRDPASVPASDSALIARADRGRLLGDPAAPIWVVMISDFQCPYCRQWHDSSLASLRREYVATGKVRLAYLNLPLRQHPHARPAAVAALCAGAQDRFWPFAEGVFAAQEELARLADPEPVFSRLAAAQRLDGAAFAECRRSSAVGALVDNDVRQAMQAGVRSTPTFLVGGFLLEGAAAWPTFRRAVDSALVLARQAGGR
jgi:protein-disulfide isomerase